MSTKPSQLREEDIQEERAGSKPEQVRSGRERSKEDLGPSGLKEETDALCRIF